MAGPPLLGLVLGVHTPGRDALADALTRLGVPICLLPLLAGSSHLKRGNCKQMLNLLFSHLSELPDWAFTVACHDIKTSWRQRNKSRPASMSVSSLKYYVSLIFSASFLSAPNVTPIIAGKRPHFQKNRNPFEFIPIPSSTLDPLLFLNEH